MNLKVLLNKTGPGLVVAATGLGAGDIVAASVAGAQFGSALLWAVVVGAILKFCLNEGLARWQLATGLTFLEGWIDYLPRLFNWYFCLYLLLWSFMVAAAMMAGAGLAAHAIFPGLSVTAWGIIHSIVAFVLVLKGGYRILETIMKVFIGVMFVCILICAILVMPPVSEIVGGIFLFSFPDNSLLNIVGIIGGVGGSVTIMSYGYWMREKGWNSAENIGDMRVDLGIAYGLTAVFGLAIMVVAAGVEVDAVSGNNMALAIANELESALGSPGKWIFLVGFWGAVASSMIGVWHGVPYLFANYFYHVRDKKSLLEEPESISKTPAYLFYLVGMCSLPMILLAADRPVWIVIIYSVTGAFFMPLVALLLLYMNSVRKWLGEYKNGLLSKALLIACLLLFSFLLWIQVQSQLS